MDVKMPRPKTISDEDVLDVAHRLIHEHGPDALTFAAVAKACGLSGATLVQRFKSKAELVRSTLLRAWDLLDEKTASLAASVPKTPEGAIELLVELSGDYGGIEAYANGLLVLREDLRDPVLRARGAEWKASLSAALNDCFARLPNAPQDVGLLLATQWQGSLLWWSFDPQGKVEHHVATSLRHFMATANMHDPDSAAREETARRSTSPDSA
jgi:AcrR family transcriptional regulator